MLRQTLLSWLFIVFTLVAFGQTIEIYKEKGNSFFNTNIDSSIYYYQLADTLALQQKNTSQNISTGDVLLTLYRMKEQFEKAAYYGRRNMRFVETPRDSCDVIRALAQILESINPKEADQLYQQALRLATTLNDSTLLRKVYSNYASVKRINQDPFGSIDYYLKTLTYETRPYPRSNIYLDIATLFLDLNNFDRAEEYFQKCIQLKEKHAFKDRHGGTAISYGIFLMTQQRYSEAQVEFDQAIPYFYKKEKWSSLLKIYNNQAELNIKLKDWVAAKQHNEAGLQYFDQAIPNYQCTALTTKCKILLHANQYHEALATIKESLEIAESLQLQFHIQVANKYLSLIYEHLNKSDLALISFKKYKLLEDSLYRFDQLIQMNYLEAEYKRKEQTSAIALLDSQNSLQSNQLYQQKLIILIGGISLIFIIGLSFFLFQLLQKIKLKNNIISNALTEKDTLLREIHHRVKNNLQLVSSLLSLQSRHVNDPNALEVLNSGKSRIRSMALIHQDLYNKENLTGVSIKEYLEKLCKELMHSHQVDPNRIRLKTNISNIQLDVDTLVPLGLIINELITNALKHAFPHEQSGVIMVSLQEVDQQLKLSIVDNGIGIHQKKRSEGSFGYKLITTLLHQLQGTLEQQVDNGTRLFLTFNKYKIAA